MTRPLDKTLDRIRKLGEKGQPDKALLMVDEALGQSPNELELVREEMAQALALRKPDELLKRLRKHLARHALADLIRTDQRVPFINLVRESTLFRGGLTDQLLNAQAFDSLTDMLIMAQEGDRRWLVNNWAQVAREIQDPRHASLWQVATGLGFLVLADWDQALASFSSALNADSRYLKKIMQICQRFGPAEASPFLHRMRMIRLVIAAGRRDESLSLLQALGLESRENALQVLIELPSLLPDMRRTPEFTRLSFSLACFLQDGEILTKVLDEMGGLREEELFHFQKQAQMALDDTGLRRNVLLRIAQHYINQGAWEGAALLLEGLFHEDAHPEIVALMEYVLENYPILTKLHLLVASFQLGHRMEDSGLRHLQLIREVPEFAAAIQKLLEQFLDQQYRSDAALFLFEMLPAESDRAALIALHLIADEATLPANLAEQVFLKAPAVSPTALWLMAQLSANLRSGNFNSSIELVRTILETFSHLAHEFLPLVEQLAASSEFVAEQISIIVEQHLDRIQPRDLWVLLSRPFSAPITPHLMLSPVETVPIQDLPTPELREAPTTEFVSAALDAVQIPDERTDPQVVLSPELEEINRLAARGERVAAAQVAEKLAEKYPQHAAIVLGVLEEMTRLHPIPLVWERSRLNILIRSERFEEAAQLGRQLLIQDLPEQEAQTIHQLMGFVHEGLGKLDRACAHFCQASRNPRYYAKNRNQLINYIFPHRIDLLEGVLELVLSHRDQVTWKRLIELWERSGLGDPQKIVDWQKRFAAEVNEGPALVDLAYWLVETGRYEEAISTLRTLHLSDSRVRAGLMQVTDLIRMRHPQDIHATFLLGRFFLIQGEIPKAVDTFRNLARDKPKSAEKIYQYLRKYLDKHPDQTGTTALYGLMIRIALELRLLLDGVHLLREFALRDGEGAQSLSSGVYRVLKAQPNKDEALYSYLCLLLEWQNFEAIVLAHEENEWGSEMAEARLAMLQKAASQPQLADRAWLCQAQVFWVTQRFEECFQATMQIRQPEGRANSLPLLAQLAERFPQRMDILRESAWLSWHFGSIEDAISIYQRILQGSDSPHLLEAFAVLREAGLQLDLRDIASRAGMEMNLALIAVRQLYGKLRLWSLSRWEDQGGPVPVDALIWLLEQGRGDFHHWFNRMKPFLGKEDRALLDACTLRAMGQTYYAAMRLAGEPANLEITRSLCLEADLLEQALMARQPGQPMPLLLTRHYMTQFGKARTLFARAADTRRKWLAKAMNIRDILDLGDQHGTL
jgi:tetratricopeptide (TPR) repeat protein